MPYFHDCTTKEEAKKKHKKLVKELHPDKGGDALKFKEMQNEFDNFSEHKNYSNEYDKAAEDVVRTAYENYTNYFNNINKSTFNKFSFHSPFETENRKNNNENTFFGNPSNQQYIEIPADHPIHQEIKNLKDENIIYRKNILDLRGDLNLLHSNNIRSTRILEEEHRQTILESASKITKLDFKVIELNAEIKDRDDYIIELQNTIKMLQNDKNKSLLERAKKWVGL